MKVHRQPGPGLLESVYKEYLAYEFEENDVFFERQKLTYTGDLWHKALRSGLQN